MASALAFLSLPLRIFEDQSADPISSISNIIASQNAEVSKLAIPDLKIGTLDALIQQADQLAKLASSCQTVVSKVADSLSVLCPGDSPSLAHQKAIDNKPPIVYLKSLSWDKSRYRVERPIAELIDILQAELDAVDDDSKQKLSQYMAAKNSLAASEKSRSGNLTTKSLAPFIDPSQLLQNSEYLETQLVAVPISSRKDFARRYETLCEMIVPRSSMEIAEDGEFVLYGVTVFKKHAAEFQAKCRENKWFPRTYQYVEGSREEEQHKHKELEDNLAKKFSEVLRFEHLAWSESVKIWAHVTVLRVFVETVLRYGLPIDYVVASVSYSSQSRSKVKAALNKAYSFLGANIQESHKNGKSSHDDNSASDVMTAILGVEEEFTPYVFYELNLP